MKREITIASLLFLMPFAGTLQGAEKSAPGLIEQAEAARKEASGLGYEWRDTAKLIESARAALAKGQQEESDRLAKEALLQGREAVAQAKYMEKNWQKMIPRQ
jgi:hypothetical protein